MSFVTDNYQWLILVGIGLTALIVAIIGIILKQEKQPRFKVNHIMMDPVSKSDHPASDPNSCSVHVNINLINIGSYQTVTRVIFRIIFDSKNDEGKKIIATNHTYFSNGIEPKKERPMSKDLYPHKKAINWKKAKLIISVKYNKTSGREITRRIGCKRFKNSLI